MNKKIIFLLALLCGAAFLPGCSDELSDTSVIADPITPQNEFDKWLEENYLKVYNINFQYRFKFVESDMDYHLTPAEYEQAIMMAKLTQHLILEAYDEVTGSTEFIRTYFPKLVHLIGSPAYNENNSVTLGVAEGGKKMTLYEVNQLRQRYQDRNLLDMNERYFKTMHHEFAHILHQTKPYTSDFNAITASSYVGDACFSTYNASDVAARKDGFVTAYSSKSPDEDFVENLSLYVTVTAAEWETILADGGEKGRPLIEQKIDIVRQYMQNTWNIDIDRMRAAVLRRQSEIWVLDFNL